ncbi:MAG: DUF3365 domain-containing protein [Cytophagales bacterium]|nr:DUF3365 domain-containing protein [Cytophagales bacterium]
MRESIILSSVFLSLIAWQENEFSTGSAVDYAGISVNSMEGISGYAGDGLNFITENEKFVGAVNKSLYTLLKMSVTHSISQSEPSHDVAHVNNEHDEVIADSEGFIVQVENKVTQSDTTNYEKLGKEFASNTQKVLGKNLTQAMMNGGPENALTFCNVKAYPLTDSMAQFFDVKIKRVTDKPRNQLNKANAEQLAYIKTLKRQKRKSEPLKPLMTYSEKTVSGLYPIVTNGMCLACHGKPKEAISQSTFAVIKSLYPEDKAVNYSVDEIRGVWVIEMNKRD